ncbi:putative ABC-type xenobiotic transporter [Helianthus annuus]|nr:putative ABC-type xenobiotic transporter [Helianthus annuus]
MVFGRVISSTVLGLQTCQIFFKKILNSILHAPMSFFDTTPSGRILSRGFFLATSREITRLDSITKAPVIHHFSESISGVMTIRCLGSRTDLFQENNWWWKSTLIQVLFSWWSHLVEVITIDGINISTLGLHDLRSRFGIIPQEPILFEGTVRSNIDPIGQHSDEEIGGVLNDASLTMLSLQNLAVVHGRSNGFCDSQTDAVIQKIIREDFADCTIISIAHRIPTVMDCDRVLVIDAGYAKEFDKPSRLIERPSLFGALVQEVCKTGLQGYEPLHIEFNVYYSYYYLIYHLYFSLFVGHYYIFSFNIWIIIDALSIVLNQ